MSDQVRGSGALDEDVTGQGSLDKAPSDFDGASLVSIFRHEKLYEAIADNISVRVEDRLRARRQTTIQVLAIGVTALLVVGGGLLTFHFDTLVGLKASAHLEDVMPPQISKTRQELERLVRDEIGPNSDLASRISNIEARLSALEEPFRGQGVVTSFRSLASELDEVVDFNPDQRKRFVEILEKITPEIVELNYAGVEEIATNLALGFGRRGNFEGLKLLYTRFSAIFERNVEAMQLMTQAMGAHLIGIENPSKDISPQDKSMYFRILDGTSQSGYPEYDLPHRILFKFSLGDEGSEIKGRIGELKNLNSSEKVTAKDFFEKFCDAEKIGRAFLPEVRRMARLGAELVHNYRSEIEGALSLTIDCENI